MKYSRLLLIAICFLAVQFFPLALGKTLFFGDNYSLMVPGKLFTVGWLKEGILPLWNPTIFAGISWIGDVNQSIFYPTTLLFFIFSPAIAVNLTIVLHELLAFFGIVVLLSRWRKDEPSLAVGGLLWMFSTHMLGSIHNISTLQSVPWFPWIIWAGLEVGDKKRAPILFALLVLLQFTGGYPQHVLLSIGTAVIFSAALLWKQKSVWQWLRSWLTTAGWTIGLSTVIWLPFADVFLRSTRMLQTVEQAQVGSLHPIMLAKIFLASVFDNAAAGMKWGPVWSEQLNAVFYLSWFGLLVFGWLFWRFKRLPKFDVFLIIFSGLTVLVSFGSYLPFYSLMQKMIPLLRVGRYPSMLLVLTNLSLIIVIARNFSLLKFSRQTLKRLTVLAGVLLCVALGMYLLVWANPQEVWQAIDTLSGGRLAASQFHTFARDTVILKTLTTQLVLVGACFCASLFFLQKRKLLVVALLIGLDMVISTHGMFIFANSSVYSTREELQKSIAPEFSVNKGRMRFLTRNSNMPYADFGSYWEALVVRAPFSDSYVDKAELADQIVLKSLRDGLTPDWNMVVGVPLVHGYTTLLPQDYAAIWQSSEQPGINFVDRIQSSNPLLREWAVGSYVVDNWFPLYGEELPSAHSSSVSNLDFYTLPGSLDRFRYEDDLPANLLSRVETPNSIKLTLPSDNHTSLIIADRYDKDWRVTVNSREAEIQNYNGMRRIALEEGQNIVRMWYEPLAFYYGVIISFITLGCASFYLFLGRRKV